MLKVSSKVFYVKNHLSSRYNFINHSYYHKYPATTRKYLATSSYLLFNDFGLNIIFSDNYTNFCFFSIINIVLIISWIRFQGANQYRRMLSYFSIDQKIFYDGVISGKGADFYNPNQIKLI